MVGSHALRPIEVLLVDDDLDEVQRICDLLAAPTFHVHHGSAIAAAELTPLPDVMIVDAGAEVPDLGVPMVALTDPAEAEPELFALGRGALDHVAKDELGTSALPRAVRYVLERHRLEDELRRLAHIDPLTGLHNRRYLTKRLEGAVGAARRHGHPLTVCICDLDDFKVINDRWGHLAGDAVLQAVADALAHDLRAEDTVARFGGDEFCMIFPHVGRREATMAVERIRERMDALRVDVGETTLTVSATFGLAELDGLHATGRALFEAADQDLYEGKAERHQRRRPA